MDSINKNQEEKNHENLGGSEALEKLKELADKKACFFCTDINMGKHMNTRPMSVQKMDDQGNLYFLSANDSHKNLEIDRDPLVQLFFQGSAHSDFLTLQGKAEISTDKNLIKELWEPLLRTWFTEGIDDPRITAIKVIPENGYYWDTKHGNAVAFLKMAAGAVMGKTLDDSIEGEIKP